MKKSNLIMTVFGIASLLAAGTLGQAKASRPADKTVELRQVLKEVGNRYDCYFTMEIGLKAGDVTNSLEGRRVSQELKQKSLKQELERLSETVPSFTYKFDIYNSKIIHVIDTGLAREKNYAMEQVIDTISFDGTVFDFVNAVGQKGVSVSSRGFFDTRELQLIDLSTRVYVNEKKKTVRNILTNSLPLKGRARVLWIARTELGGSQTTYVRYMNSRL